MPEPMNKPGTQGETQTRIPKKEYTPEMREQYREYYKAKSRQRADAQRNASSPSPIPARTAAKPTQSAPNPARTAAKPTQSAPNPARSVVGSTQSAPRPAKPTSGGARPPMPPRAGGASRSGGGSGRNLPNRYIRMLITAAMLVLVMFGIIKGIGALTRAEEADYVKPTKITPAPVITVAPEITKAPEAAPDQATEPPEADPAAQSATQAPTAEPTPETDEGYFPTETARPDGTAQPVETANANAGRTARIRFAGDLVIDDDLLDAAKNSKTGTYDFNDYFGMIQDALSNADLTIANVDGPMGGKGNRGNYYGYPQFNTPPTLLYALKNAGVDMLSLCNNHCLDTWFDGLKQTIVNCDYVGMLHFGAYGSQEARDTPEVFEVNGIKIGFLNYTQSTNTMGEQKSLDKNALIYGIRRTNGANYAKDIQALRKAGAEVVVVYMHWGSEYKRKPDDNQLYLAKQIANAGADIIVGGHPHMVQPMTYVNGTTASGETNRCPTIFSIGNFLSEHRDQYMDSGIIFEFTLQENLTTGEIEVVSPKYLSVYVWRVGSEGAYDFRVVNVEATIANRPAGMSDSTYARLLEVRSEMAEVLDPSMIERISY